MKVFGSGVLQGFRSDVSPSTPINFGLVQDVAVDISFTTKMLYGQFQFPLAVGRGTAKATGKAKMANISGIAFGTLFFGVAPVLGQLATSFGEGPTNIPTSPFQITAVNAATFVDDLGVINALTGLPFAKVASAPAAGQYSVAAGVYTFNTADVGKAVLLNYTYTIAASGQQITVANPLLGFAPTFQANLYTTFGGLPLSVKFFSCIASKLNFATKLEDFTIPELDFDILANAAGNVFEWSFGEVS